MFDSAQTLEGNQSTLIENELHPHHVTIHNQQLPQQFNYNPLYTGIQQHRQANQHYRNNSSHLNGSLTSNHEDKTSRNDLGAILHPPAPADETTLSDDQNTGVLGDMYQYQTSSSDQVRTIDGMTSSSVLRPCDAAFHGQSLSTSELSFVSHQEEQSHMMQQNKSKQRPIAPRQTPNSTCRQRAPPTSFLADQTSLRSSTPDNQGRKEMPHPRLKLRDQQMNCTNQAQATGYGSINQTMNEFHQQHMIFSNPLVDQHQNQASGQLDLSEECGGLFVEYQTSRNGLGGCLEELNSLNVTNCDSDTLEDQINMLSGDDCFATNDDLHDFGIGGSGNNLLDMLLMNPGNQSTMSTVGCSNANNFQSSGPTPPLSLPRSNDQSSACQHQFAVPNTSESHQGSIIPDESNDAEKSRNSDESDSKAAPKKVGRLKAKTSSSCNPNSKGRRTMKDKTPGQHQRGSVENYGSSDKIATTNTNRRLLPKKIPPKRSTNSGPTSTRTISPSSVSSNMVSPSSSSQSADLETPYKLQLDNLRKKLRIGPPVYLATQSELCKVQLAACNATSSTSCNEHGSTSSGTTYLIARPVLESRGLEPSGGTIYLRTQNGLVPLSATSDKRAAGLPLMKITTSNRVVGEQFVQANSLQINSGMRPANFVIQPSTDQVDDHSGQVIQIAGDGNLSNFLGSDQSRQQIELHQQPTTMVQRVDQVNRSSIAESSQHYHGLNVVMSQQSTHLHHENQQIGASQHHLHAAPSA